MEYTGNRAEENPTFAPVRCNEHKLLREFCKSWVRPRGPDHGRHWPSSVLLLIRLLWGIPPSIMKTHAETTHYFCMLLWSHMYGVFISLGTKKTFMGFKCLLFSLSVLYIEERISVKQTKYSLFLFMQGYKKRTQACMLRLYCI